MKSLSTHLPPHSFVQITIFLQTNKSTTRQSSKCKEQSYAQDGKVVGSDVSGDTDANNQEDHFTSNNARGKSHTVDPTVDHYKSKTEEVTFLKKDFKQKEDKFLEEFLDIKKLKDKIEDRLYKQDQSVQTVHMLCKPKSFYDEKHKVAIGYKNPLCLARAKQAQSALYNGHVLVTTNHTPTVIHDSEDTRELAEITRNRMLLKMQSPLYDNNRKKAETLAPKPISALTVYPPNTPVKLVPRILPTKTSSLQNFDMESLNSKDVCDEDSEKMIMNVSEEEIKDALFDICDNKALGPDGYSAKFFKSAWSVIKKEVCDAIMEFFRTRRMLGEVNATGMCLITHTFYL
ncbi:hypothetical protein Tco_0494268 [Tanacetum coccineum]